MDEIFPTKVTKVPVNHKPWFTHKLRLLSEQKKEIFKKEGRSQKYKDISKQFLDAKKDSINLHIQRSVDMVKDENKSNVNKILKQLGAPPGEEMVSTFILPEHQGLDDKEIANALANYFSKISQEYQPLNMTLLPERVQNKLNSTENTEIIVEPYQVYEKIKSMNIPDSVVPGDFPPRIWKKFGVELAEPVSKLVNNILKYGKWPEAWKVEYVKVIEKVKDPQSMDDLRNISLTLFVSKLAENLIYDLLMNIFGHKIDPGQHGGREKYSVLLYLVKLVDFIMANLDKKKAVIMALLDFSKAYNRQCHNRLITCFSDLGTPSYLLKVLASYLSNRKMVVRHKGAISEEQEMPGGGPQGTNLGILIYLVNINSCGISLESIERSLKDLNSEVEREHPILPPPPKNISESSARLKYIDDMSLCQTVNKSDLRPIDWEMQRPLNFRDRTLHYLPEHANHLQNTINGVHEFCKIQKMIINEKKTQTVIFNTFKSKDFTPRIRNQNDEFYQNTEEFKLLGVDLASDKIKGISFNNYIDKCLQKGYTNLWIIRRLAEQGVSIENLLLAYNSRIRVCVEQNLPLYMFSLSDNLKKKIERLQKTSFFIILGKKSNKDYLENMKTLNAVPLEQRRIEIAENFAKKILKHPEHRNIFQFTGKGTTKSGKKVVVPFCRTARYERTAVPALAHIINNKFSHKI